ncbi:MAG: glycosyltransferase [Cyanobacteriota bacterium]
MAAGGTVTDRRRPKAALFMVACLVAGLLPHWLPSELRLVPALSLALLLGIYSVRTVILQAFRDPPSAPPVADPTTLPAVDVVVAARDEQAVIGRLVERLLALRYPADRLRLWIIDDGSEDRTGPLLDELAQRHDQLQVIHRPRDAGGGKSGALNTVLSRLQGRWMLVLDADADLQPEALERAVRHVEAADYGALQLRKAVVNGDRNLLTQAQAMEMALDAVIQGGRLANGGVAELRGNGQLLRREAVLGSGGFNEATVTDDLDLSFRLLIHGHSIGLLWDPPVEEEAVLSLPALWRQRQRWAEGGLQRFFDYTPQFFSEQVSSSQRLDLLCFFLLQYVLPVMAVADLFGALITVTSPTIWPFSIVAFGLSGVSILAGCQRQGEGPVLPTMTPFSLALGIVYLGHWFVVIPWTGLRMALLPKRLVWAKTLHLGNPEVVPPT